MRLLRRQTNTHTQRERKRDRKKKKKERKVFWQAREEKKERKKNLHGGSPPQSSKTHLRSNSWMSRACVGACVCERVCLFLQVCSARVELARGPDLNCLHSTFLDFSKKSAKSDLYLHIKDYMIPQHMGGRARAHMGIYTAERHAKRHMRRQSGHTHTHTHTLSRRPQLKASSSSKQSALLNNITEQSHHTT